MPKRLANFTYVVFPDKPVTKKPAETRMGKGKGNPELWVAVVKRGRVICEVTGVNEAEAREVLQAATYKLPYENKICTKECAREWFKYMNKDEART